MYAVPAGWSQKSKARMKYSLEQHLTRMLALAIVLVGCLASALAFRLAYTESQEFQDANLRQFSMLAKDELLSNNAPASHTFGYGDMDPELQLQLIKVNPARKSAWLPANLTLGFHTLKLKNGNWRIFIRQTKAGYRVVAAQKTDEGDEIAFRSTLIAVLPWLALLPILIWLVARIVRRSFAPLVVFAHTLETSQSERPAVLPETELAKEIIPFVQSINKQTLRIQANIAQQQRFITDASHELRTPLTALMLQAENLEQATDYTQMVARLAPLRAGIERAQMLSAQLLNQARIQNCIPNFLPLDLSPWVRRLLAEYLPIAEAKKQDLGLDDPGHITIFTNPEALELVLRNALENALRYTPDGGQVTLHLSLEQGFCIVEVIDNGPGIPATERQRVFTPFYRIPDSIPGGSGLGLSIAHEAAAKLGGTITLHERQNSSGLIFRYRQACMN